MPSLIELYLACWRLSSLIVQEDGPYDLFGKARVAAGVRYNEWGVAYGTNVISEAMTCIWCTSIWVSLFLLIIRRTRLGRALILWLAVSAGAIALNDLIDASSEKPP